MILDNPYHRRRVRKILRDIKRLESENASLKKINAQLKRILTLNGIEYKEKL